MISFFIVNAIKKEKIKETGRKKIKKYNYFENKSLVVNIES